MMTDFLYNVNKYGGDTFLLTLILAVGVKKKKKKTFLMSNGSVRELPWLHVLYRFLVTGFNMSYLVNEQSRQVRHGC